MVQAARNVTMEAWGFLVPGQYRIHDRDPKYGLEASSNTTSVKSHEFFGHTTRPRNLAWEAYSTKPNQCRKGADAELAHHFTQGEVWDKAFTYWRQAGEKALSRSAHREAVRSFEQALSALQHLPETRDTREQAIALRLALRGALWPSGDFQRILAVLCEAEALAEPLDDPRQLGQISVFLSAYFYHSGAYDQAIAATQRALTLARASGDVVLHALANNYLGVAHQSQGNYRWAIDCYEQTIMSLDGAQRYERFGFVVLPSG